MGARALISSRWGGYLLAGVFFILAVVSFVRGRGEPPARDATRAEPAAAVTPTDAEEVVRFTSTLNLAKLMGADTSSQPLFRAGVGQAVDRDVEFKVPETGEYRLVMQMVDAPFVDEQQVVGEYLEVVQEGRPVGQTFTVGSTVPQLGGVKVKLEARDILTNQPAEVAPDAPMTATLYTGDRKKIDEVVVPVDQAGLNDTWRWVAVPFAVPLSSGSGRTFFVEFTSPAKVTGWALSRVSNGFEDIDDHYPGGELLINGKPPEIGPSADLTFAVLTRSTNNKQPRVLVDETEMTFSPLTDAPDWFVGEPVELREGTHLLIVQSSNPHLSFFRFVFVPAGADDFKRPAGAQVSPGTDQEETQRAEESGVSKDAASPTPTASPSPGSRESAE